MDDADFDRFTVYAHGDKVTLYINDATDEFNNFLQSRNDLKDFRVFVARINGTVQSEYVLLDGSDNIVFHSNVMQMVEDYINYEMLGVIDSGRSHGSS